MEKLLQSVTTFSLDYEKMLNIDSWVTSVMVQSLNVTEPDQKVCLELELDGAAVQVMSCV